MLRYLPREKYLHVGWLFLLCVELKSYGPVFKTEIIALEESDPYRIYEQRRQPVSYNSIVLLMSVFCQFLVGTYSLCFCFSRGISW